MIRLVVGALILALLALITALNQESLADLNLLGLRLQGIPTVAVALVGFVAGIGAALIVYASGVADRRRAQMIRDREEALAKRERALAEKESAAVASPAAQPEPAVRRGFAARLFHRRRP
jgi:uncharacterized integral membrane protein